MNSMTLYFHNEMQRKVSIVHIHIREDVTNHEKISMRRRKGWICNAEAEITDASNYHDSNRRWKYSTSHVEHEEYPPSDDYNKIVRFFKAQLRKSLGQEITQEQYETLKKQYEKEIAKNEKKA